MQYIENYILNRDYLIPTPLDPVNFLIIVSHFRGVIKTNAIRLRPKAAVVLTTSEEDWEVSDKGKVELKHAVFSD